MLSISQIDWQKRSTQGRGRKSQIIQRRGSQGFSFGARISLPTIDSLPMALSKSSHEFSNSRSHFGSEECMAPNTDHSEPTLQTDETHRRVKVAKISPITNLKKEPESNKIITKIVVDDEQEEEEGSLENSAIIKSSFLRKFNNLDHLESTLGKPESNRKPQKSEFNLQNICSPWPEQHSPLNHKQ